MDSVIRKKFYRDLSSEEIEFLTDVIDEMRRCPIDIPAHVLERMIQREIIPYNINIMDGDGSSPNVKILSAIPGYQEAVLALDKGSIYEVSNEAIESSRNPFRIVLSRESGDGYTYFVKIAPVPNPAVVRILDVWRRRGKTPIYPPLHALKHFVRQEDWDIEEAIGAFLEESSDENYESELEPLEDRAVSV